MIIIIIIIFIIIIIEEACSGVRAKPRGNHRVPGGEYRALPSRDAGSSPHGDADLAGGCSVGRPWGAGWGLVPSPQHSWGGRWMLAGAKAEVEPEPLGVQKSGLWGGGEEGLSSVPPVASHHDLLGRQGGETPEPPRLGASAQLCVGGEVGEAHQSLPEAGGGGRAGTADIPPSLLGRFSEP